MEKETFEEATEHRWFNTNSRSAFEEGFIQGAKWQQERMYSEEEVLQLLLRLQQTEYYNSLYEWFEQFKKKIR